MYSGELVPSTTCLEITTSLTSSRPGRSNMIASRMLSMIDRSPRAPRLALDGLPGDRPERLFRSYTTSWFAYPLEGGIDPCPVVYPALPSRSFYWLCKSLRDSVPQVPFADEFARQARCEGRPRLCFRQSPIK